MPKVRQDNDPQITLDRLENNIPTNRIKKYANGCNTVTSAYKKRKDLREQIEQNKGAHRNTIFGDCADITMKPQLDAILYTTQTTTGEIR